MGNVALIYSSYIPIAKSGVPKLEHKLSFWMTIGSEESPRKARKTLRVAQGDMLIMSSVLGTPENS